MKKAIANLFFSSALMLFLPACSAPQWHDSIDTIKEMPRQMSSSTADLIKEPALAAKRSEIKSQLAAISAEISQLKQSIAAWGPIADDGADLQKKLDEAEKRAGELKKILTEFTQ